MHIADPELDRDFVYFLAAYYFHWTPEETKNVEARLLDAMLCLLPLWHQKVNEVKEHG
jgi:hypothetical protein